MSNLSGASFDLHPSFNDTIWPAILIGANDGRDRIIWWRKYCRQLIFTCLLLVVLFVLGVHFLLLSKQQSAILDKLEQNVAFNSAIKGKMEKSEQICKKHHSAILDKLEQNVVVINSTIESKMDNVISKTDQYLNIVMTFVGIVTFVGFITVILMVTVTIWIYLNIRANNAPSASEAIEPKQDNDVEVDNIGSQQQILQVPLEAAMWWHYLSAPIPKGDNFAGNDGGQRRAPSIPKIAIDDFSTYTDDEAANRAASPLPALAIPSVDKRYKCKQCPYSTHRSHCLKMHMLIHTGQKPHECKKCGKRFRQSSHLYDHLRAPLLHTRKRPYKCNDCKSTFTTRSNLNRHIRTFHLGDG
uniref:C2H2-type domain-containing protein n=1 Tax=Globodera pallida TaxID=36090 RepID=A0A183BPI9_GLOPA